MSFSQILTFTIVILISCICISNINASRNNGLHTILEPQVPNFQYFEKPKYRYPYYDENGKGYILYGTGDGKLHQYRKFSPLEGVY